MGCFLGCFGSKKDRKRETQRYKVIPRDQQRHVIQNAPQATSFPEQVIVEKPSPKPFPEQVVVVKPESPVVAELRVKPQPEEQVIIKRKVTFDSNVKTYEHIPVDDSTESLLEKEEEGNFPSVAPLQSPKLSRSNSEDGSVNSSVGSYPPNHRYQNCQESDDEVEDLDYEEDFDDEDDEDNNYEDEDDYEEICNDMFVCQKVWSEEIPAASEESRVEDSMETVGAKRFARDRSDYVHPVLNPVENLSQWKAAKAKGTTPSPNSQKENFSFNLQTPKSQKNQEIAVDASLSNWLTSSEATSIKTGSSIGGGRETISSEKSFSPESTTTTLRSQDDRPILGVLTEELRQYSATYSSPRKSPSREDMPIIGSVGSYWSHSSSAKDSGSVSSYKGIPNTTSKYREDKKVTWHSTPFETRLERALNRGSANA